MSIKTYENILREKYIDYTNINKLINTKLMNPPLSPRPGARLSSRPISRAAGHPRTFHNIAPEALFLLSFRFPFFDDVFNLLSGHLRVDFELPSCLPYPQKP